MVRSDLPVGLLAAQIVHAAGESVQGPAPPGTHAVVLAVAGEAELRELFQEACARGLACAPIVKNDPPYTDQLMAIGFAPAPRKEVYRFLKRLPLLR